MLINIYIYIYIYIHLCVCVYNVTKDSYRCCNDAFSKIMLYHLIAVIEQKQIVDAFFVIPAELRKTKPYEYW